MTIAKKAVASFLNRELDDWSFLKIWKRAEIWEELRNLPVRPRITSPYRHWHHQLVGLLLFCLFDSFLLFLNMGTGKTRILLEGFAYRKRNGEANRAIIFALNDVNVQSIIDDAAVHTPQFRVKALIGSSEQRWHDLENSGAHIFVMSYAGLRAMCTKRIVNKRTKKTEEKAQERLVKRLLKIVDWVAYDEIHKCKNHKSVTYACAKYISKHNRFVYGSTGTAFGRNPEDLWAQFALCDKGESLGTTLGLFKAVFFVEKMGFGGWPIWEFDKRQKPEFQAAIKHRSIYYNDREIGDMPRRVPLITKLRPAKSLVKHYNDALQMLKSAVRDEDVDNSWIRMRMICSGFISYKDADSKKIEIEIPDNPKLAALESFIEQVPLNFKGIIVHEFVYSGLIVERQLKEMGYPYLAMNGKTKDNVAVYNAFRKDTKHRFLVMNWKSGGTGGNYQVAPYMHFYESMVSPIERKQTEYRIRRRDNLSRRCFYRDPIIQGSVEEDILGFLKEGKNFYKELMEGGRRKKNLKRL